MKFVRSTYVRKYRKTGMPRAEAMRAQKGAPRSGEKSGRLRLPSPQLDHQVVDAGRPRHAVGVERYRRGGGLLGG